MEKINAAELNRTANLLGALALGVVDEVRAASAREVHHAGGAPAALVLLGHEPGLTNDALAKLLSLTHTGAVRLVHKLVVEGLVERRLHPADRRAVSLYLTSSGETARLNILGRRSLPLTSLLTKLTDEERSQLTPLLEKLLRALVRNDLHALSICRLCDDGACQNCPIDVAVGVGQASSRPG